MWLKIDPTGGGDDRGNFNHWWLWTDLDSGGQGLLSAYSLGGQGNDQADDIHTNCGAVPSDRRHHLS
jgi:hypothetical protein